MSLPSPLILITDRLSAQLPLQKVITQALSAGCKWILVREKDLPDNKLLPLVQEIVALAGPYGAAVSVSSNPAIAAAAQAQGLHLSRGASPSAARKICGEKMLIGVSAHSLKEAQQAGDDGADYVFLSPIFVTPSKPGYGPPLGLDQLHRVVCALPIPIIALGGVNPHNAADCLRAGVCGVAVMGAVMHTPQPGNIITTILQNLEQKKENHVTPEN